MRNPLFRHWDKAALQSAPFLHPADIIPVSQQAGILSTADFVRQFENGDLSPSAFHLGLYPQPYLGDLDNADIVILLLNPGLSALDYFIENSQTEFRNEIRATIRGEKRDHLFLDSNWIWTAGFAWWESKLRGVAQIISKERFSGRYGNTLKDLAHRIAAVQLVPYHSFGFKGSKKLASSVAAREYVNQLDEQQTIIVLRSVRDWQLPDRPNVIKYPQNLARSASLAPGTPGGDAILRHYGISS